MHFLCSKATSLHFGVLLHLFSSSDILKQIPALYPFTLKLFTMILKQMRTSFPFLQRARFTLVQPGGMTKAWLLSPDSKAIVDGNLKLILGLVWTLILHYSISMPVWEDEGDDDAKKQTPKQRLLGWIQNKIPYLPITNFNQNWQDGKALGALVDSCAPGKCPWLPKPSL